MKRLRRLALLLVFSVAFLWLSLCVLLFVKQRTIVFPGAGPWMNEPRIEGASLLRVPLPDGGEAIGLYKPPANGSPTVVHFHGNGGSVPSEAPFGQRLADAGLGVLLVEYPGYVPAPGFPSEHALLASARALLEHLNASGIPSSRIVLHGHSLGTGVAAAMAAEGRGARLVLVAPYTSLPEVGADAFWFVPVRLLLRDRFDTRALAPKLSLPTLVVHGARDQVVPVRMGRALAELIPGARLLELPDGDHYPLDDAFDKILQFASKAAPAGP